MATKDLDGWDIQQIEELAQGLHAGHESQRCQRYLGSRPSGGNILLLDFFWFTHYSVESTESIESKANYGENSTDLWLFELEDHGDDLLRRAELLNDNIDIMLKAVCFNEESIDIRVIEKQQRCKQIEALALNLKLSGLILHSMKTDLIRWHPTNLEGRGCWEVVWDNQLNTANNHVYYFLFFILHFDPNENYFELTTPWIQSEILIMLQNLCQYLYVKMVFINSGSAPKLVLVICLSIGKTCHSTWIVHCSEQLLMFTCTFTPTHTDTIHVDTYTLPCTHKHTLHNSS